MNLERSIDSLAKRFDRLYPVTGFTNKTGLSHWKGKLIIPLDEWLKFRDTPYGLDYFPDDFDRLLTYVPEDESEGKRNCDDVKRWDSDFLGLMEYTKNPNYGRLKCFRCLLSPDGDDPIFIGINKLVAKGLTIDEREKGEDSIQYPCQIVNRFQCPYERTNINKDDDVEATDSQFNVEDLFRLQRMAFIVEIALAKARKNDSEIQIRDKQDLLHALADTDIFTKILHQAGDTFKSSEYLGEITAGQDINYITDYFTRVKDNIDLNELRFY